MNFNMPKVTCRGNVGKTTAAGRGGGFGTYGNMTNFTRRVMSNRWNSVPGMKISPSKKYNSYETLNRQSNKVTNWGGWEYGFGGQDKKLFNQWQWSKGYNITSKERDKIKNTKPLYNVYLDVMDTIDEDKRINVNPNAPVERVCRKRVEDDIPKRNFGDYDPVHPMNPPNSMYVPSSCEFRGHLSLRQEKRRVIFRGIGENDIKMRIKRQQQGQEADWRDPLRHKYDEVFRADSLGHDESVGIKTEKHENDNETESIYSCFSPRLSQEGLADEENYYESLKDCPSLSDNLSESELQESRKMIGKRWYEVDESASINFVRTEREEDKVDDWTGEAVQTSSTGQESRYEIRIPGSSARQAINSQKTSNISADYGQVSWIWPSNTGVADHTEETFAQGYSSTDAIPDVKPFDLNKNENLFCEQVDRYDYFYRLKRRPTEANQGRRVFGFELEFWPRDDPVMKEAVLGLEMTDPLLAKDSVFAAALKKLTGIIEIKNTIRPSFNERATLKESSEVNIRSSMKESVQESSVNRVYTEPAQSSNFGSRTRFETKVEDFGDRYHKDTKEERNYSSGKGRGIFTFKEKQSTRRDKYEVPKKEENFRIAIPREPSLIDEQFKGNRRHAYANRQGFGYNNKY